MAVNGIEIEVGQMWATRANRRVKIKGKNPVNQTYIWETGSGVYTDKGLLLTGRETRDDLVRILVHGPSAVTPGPVEFIPKTAWVDVPPLLGSYGVHAQLTEPLHLDVVKQSPEVDPRFAAATYGHDLKVDPQEEKRIAHAFGGVMAGVGDINSSTKGSGARFNTGKPPYELLPLRLMVELYRAAIFDPDEAQKRAMTALSFLADFQERGHSDSLLKAMLAMGPGAWADCANVFGYGQRKYLAWNWAKGMAWSIPIACAARHLEAIILGEANDPESGLPHRGHAMCNAVMLATYERTFPEGDDRAAAGLLAPIPAAPEGGIKEVR